MEIKKYNCDMRTALCEQLIEMITQDNRIVWLDTDLMASSGMKKLKEAHPENCLNCGIQEANALGVAAGLSAQGMIPFVHSFSAFSSRRIADQIFVSGIYAKQNIRIVGSDPGIAACPNGGTHMSLEDIGILRSMPGTIILDPCDAVQLKAAVKMSTEQPGIYYIRLMRKSKDQFYPEDQKFEIGKAAELAEGSDITLIAAGTICVAEALKAAELLKARDISARVLDMFTIKPLDRDAVLKAARETGGIITVENHNIYNGLGSAVAEVLAESRQAVPFVRLGVPDSVGEVGTVDYMLEKFRFSGKDIAAAAQTLLER